MAETSVVEEEGRVQEQFVVVGVVLVVACNYSHRHLTNNLLGKLQILQIVLTTPSIQIIGDVSSNHQQIDLLIRPDFSELFVNGYHPRRIGRPPICHHHNIHPSVVVPGIRHVDFHVLCHSRNGVVGTVGRVPVDHIVESFVVGDLAGEFAAVDVGLVEIHGGRHGQEDGSAVGLLEARGSQQAEEGVGTFVEGVEGYGHDVGGKRVAEVLAVLQTSAEGGAVLAVSQGGEGEESSDEENIAHVLFILIDLLIWE